MSDNSDEESESEVEEDEEETKEPVYVLKEVTLASGLKTKKWLREDQEYN